MFFLEPCRRKLKADRAEGLEEQWTHQVAWVKKKAKKDRERESE